ncbi:hypothetical protein TSAR_009820 [Trichomalopsis sarcophagae]|uniref:Uncharacterized protein n=1 Tax=Trichomalopsis sarcophagae TaxID=543379 RepID=A0A232ENZ3_9HYME|nr:hypothetical protein TSAR_009820 [Trichomalopsis sarcophagae]
MHYGRSCVRVLCVEAIIEIGQRTIPDNRALLLALR